MATTATRILTHIGGLPEGAAIYAKGLLHLGTRAAVDQALSRLARRGHLLRAARGVYVRPVETRFGVRPPAASAVVEAVAARSGETVTSHGAAAANALGLTTQVPVREVYLTSGRSRRLVLGKQAIELRHAPRWQLLLAGRQSGEAIRALAWLGRRAGGDALKRIARTLSPAELGELSTARAALPNWMAEEISTLVSHG